jgi:7-cyano-7-deazaguanine reductase
LALLLQQRLQAEKVALPVTPPAELSNNEAAEITMSKTPSKSLKSKGLQLGRAVEWPHTPDEAQLDRVPNPQRDTNYLVRFTVPEFTSLCPVTGQPDFAHLVIDYVPGQWLLESKSLKLYVASFRNHGAFHEDCTVLIGKRISGEIKPKWLRIGGYWYPRGGIPIDVFWQTGKLPKDMWIPDQGVAPYRGRG